MKDFFTKQKVTNGKTNNKRKLNQGNKRYEKWKMTVMVIKPLSFPEPIIKHKLILN